MSAHLSFDIQLEIIKKLPVKSLIRFRSICKAWKSLIDSSHFIAGYNDRQDLPHHLVVQYSIGYGEERQVKYVSFADDDTFPQQQAALTIPPRVTRIIDSSHGLLCLDGYLEETDDSSRTQTAVIWNPAIRKSIIVVVPDHGVHRPFDYAIGFGVCPYTKDPKLVRITYIYDYMKMESISSIPCQVMVFTLSSGEWTTSSCTNHLPRKSIGFTWSQTVIGQFIYWLAHDRISVYGEYRRVIMSFDMSTEEFRELDLPDYMDGLEPLFSICRLRESLAVVEYTNVMKRVCDVWIMEHGDSKAFTKLFTINLPNASVSKTIGFRKSGEPIVQMRNDNQDFGTPCPLIVYEPCSERVKDLGIFGHLFSFFATSYTESLLLLNYDDGHIVKCGAVKR